MSTGNFEFSVYTGFEQLQREYDTHVERVQAEHIRQSAGVERLHALSIQTLGAVAIDGDALRRQFEGTKQAVSRTLVQSAMLVDVLTESVHDRFMRELSATDRSLRDDIAFSVEQIAYTGSSFLDSAAFNKQLKTATTPGVAQAISATFDRDRFTHNKVMAEQKGVKSISTTASTKAASLLLTLGMDGAVWRSADSEVASSGVKNAKRLDQAVSGASSKEIKSMMRAGLDMRVWDAAAAGFVAGTDTRTVLLAASGDSVRDAIERALPGEVFKSDDKNFFAEFASTLGLDDLIGSINRNTHVDEWLDALVKQLSPQQYAQVLRATAKLGPIKERFKSSKRRDEEEDRIFKEAAEFEARQKAQETFDRLRDETRQAPRTTGPSTEDLDLGRIIKTVVDAKPELRWLTRCDQAKIAQVVRTVKVLRANAAKKDTTITDREIFKRYHAKVQMTDANPDLVESYKILMALMGGSSKGKLPF